MNPNLSTLPAGVLVGFGVLLIVELTLAVIALIDLYRRPVQSVALDNKWIWVAIIILVNFLGSILYLAVGRKPAPPDEGSAPTSTHANSIASVVDALYGRRDDPGEH